MKKDRTAARRRRGKLLAGLFRTLSWAFVPLPWRLAQAVGATLGALAWPLAGRDRRRILDHLRLAFPQDSEAERRRIGRASLRHHGKTLGEVLWLLTRDAAAVAAHVETVGFEELDKLKASGRPAVVLTGHCGNWELLAAAINVRGTGMRVVARALDDAILQNLLVGLRSRFGTETIERGEAGAARQLLSTLRSGGVLGMLIDQDTKVDGVWVPFFGHPAYTPVGAAKIALARNAAVLPTFIERLPNGQHRAVMAPPFELPEDPVAATAEMTAKIEEQVRKNPEQWVWMHRRWRTAPLPEPLPVEQPR
ncbi:MAG: lysophospholipid acyltransferase family protein [Thermoanaerobaculia bacterium]|nr:lysophospholipid acyltransferase family protein [Thermoanaerobaculia bacterium]